MYHSYLKGFMTYRDKIRNNIFFFLQKEYKKCIYNHHKDSLRKVRLLCVLTNKYEDIKGKSNYMYMYIHRVVQIDELTITIILFINVKYLCIMIRLILFINLYLNPRELTLHFILWHHRITIQHLHKDWFTISKEFDHIKLLMLLRWPIRSLQYFKNMKYFSTMPHLILNDWYLLHFYYNVDRTFYC